MKMIIKLYALLLLIVLACCGGSSAPSTPAQIPTLEGYVQKGPFIKGTNLTIQTLNDSLSATGSTYSTQTTDDLGGFSLDSDITSNYVEIIGSGFYFNEVSGAVSDTSITLRTLSAVSENINVNILTTLAKERISYLITTGGKTFSAAVSEAERDVADIFHIDLDREAGISNFDQMDISKTGDSSAILLAVSATLQGDNTEGELSELISGIISDIKTDGTLDSATLISEINNNGIALNLSQIRSNLGARYVSQGVSGAVVPYFEYYVDSDGNGIINKYDTFTVGGTAAGLSGTVVLQNNAGDDLTIAANGSFTFATAVAYGSAYVVTVNTQPSGQTCSVSSGTGTVGWTNVSSVVVTCSSITYTVGGTVSGLTGTVVLQNNSGDNLSVAANGSFTFATAVALGSAYAVTVKTQPSGQTCVVSSGTGTVSAANITSVSLTCNAYAYVVNVTSGNVSVIDLSNNTVTATVTVGAAPYSIAMTPDGSSVYVTNFDSDTVSVIRTSDNTVTATIAVGDGPFGVAVTSDGSFVYVANFNSGTVSVIDTSRNSATATVTVGTGPSAIGIGILTDGKEYAYVANFSSDNVSVIRLSDNTVTATVTVSDGPYGVAIAPDGRTVYVVNYNSDTVSVISTSDNTVTATVAVGSSPYGVAVTPDGSSVYVVAGGLDTVSVIRTSDNTVTATIAVGSRPGGVAVTSDGSFVYVANSGSNNVSVIRTSDNTVTATVDVGTGPLGIITPP